MMLKYRPLLKLAHDYYFATLDAGDDGRPGVYLLSPKLDSRIYRAETGGVVLLNRDQY